MITFPNSPDTHKCNSRIEGDLIIFTCPLCKDFERTVNIVTGQMTFKGDKVGISHEGAHAPDGLEVGGVGLN